MGVGLGGLIVWRVGQIVYLMQAIGIAVLGYLAQEVLVTRALAITVILVIRSFTGKDHITYLITLVS